MNHEAARRRAELSRDRAWTGKLVEEAICAAWAAYPRTTEHTDIMAWPSLILGSPSMTANSDKLSDLRLAIHMMGLACQRPPRPTYGITYLRRHRLGIKDHRTYEERRDKGCELIAQALNEGFVMPSAMAA